MLQAGAVIPAALITGLRSDLPGQVTAQVTEDVYDSPTGKILLIPQGARLVGQYDAQVAFGQSRALLVWNRLIMPNGRSIVLERQPGADPEGYAGLEDEVDNHWGMLFKAAILSTILSVGSEAGTSNNENSLVQALRQGASHSISQTGEQVVGARSTSSRRSPSGRASRSGCWSPTISCSNPIAAEEAAMAKLKLGAIADDKPVKLTVELPAAVHRDLVAYGQALARETGQGAVEPAKLIGPMLARFMATDRAFAKLRRAIVRLREGVVTALRRAGTRQTGQRRRLPIPGATPMQSRSTHLARRSA